MMGDRLSELLGSIRSPPLAFRGSRFYLVPVDVVNQRGYVTFPTSSGPQAEELGFVLDGKHHYLESWDGNLQLHEKKRVSGLLHVQLAYTGIEDDGRAMMGIRGTRQLMPLMIGVPELSGWEVYELSANEESLSLDIVDSPYDVIKRFLDAHYIRNHQQLIQHVHGTNFPGAATIIKSRSH